jgi:dTDP-glucose 4,6-dehydratase
MRLLVTGGAGFIGSNFISYMLNKYENIEIVNLDKLTYAGSLNNIKEEMNNPRHTFIRGDICDRLLVQSLFEKYGFDGVIHFAAESHVDKSIINPNSFMGTNIMGTFTLLEVARNHWMDDVGTCKKDFQHARFHHISTDEVYGSLGENGHFTEKTAFAPNSPYSASKASADMIVRSYFQTYGMNVVTTNCSNNYGPKQHEEKLIPTIIRKAIALEPIPIYGDGKNIRDWLYVTDHCRAIDNVFFDGKSGETYLIGGHNEKSNMEIAHMICKILDHKRPILNNDKGVKNYRQLIQHVQDRPGHDFRYAIDDRKIRSKLGYRLEYRLDKGLDDTISYYVKKFTGDFLHV